MFLFSTCLERKYLSYHRQLSGGVGTVRAENIAKGRKTNSLEKTEMHCTQEYGLTEVIDRAPCSNLLGNENPLSFKQLLKE